MFFHCDTDKPAQSEGGYNTERPCLLLVRVLQSDASACPIGRMSLFVYAHQQNVMLKNKKHL